MNEAVLTPGAVCPGCAATNGSPRSVQRAPVPAAQRRIEISLPEIHCAGCIAGVERTLTAMPEVAAARVNLTLKRVSVTAEDAPGVEPRIIEGLKTAGFIARPLDSDALAATRSDETGRKLLTRIAVTGFALMNVMLLSISVWAGATDHTRDLMHWISAAIALPAIAIGAQPFFHNALTALRGRRLDMDVPISTAILLAVGVSVYETATSGEHAYFDAALMLTFFLLIGRYLAHVTRASARSAAAELAALEVKTAERLIQDGTTETVPVDALRPGDTLRIAPGARIAADGVVESGESEIDASLLTGETLPETVVPGASLRAGMLNISGPLTLRVSAIGEDTLLAEIGRLVETAEQSRSKYASLAQRASQVYSHAVNVLALAAFLGWGLLGGDWRQALLVGAAVLIITCPCALGLAVPAVLATASGRLFRNGVLLKDGDALERLASVDCVVFDKTGTLTTGRPMLVNAAEIDVNSFAIAAALAQGSAHPLSREIADAAAHRGITPAHLEEVRERPGYGAHGRLNGTVVRLGRAEWVGAKSTPDQTSAWLRVGDGEAVEFRFSEEARSGARATVERLRSMGLPVVLLSGDAEGPVRNLAEELGCDDWVARATPSDKVAFLEAKKAEGLHPLMVGDGLNDAAALAAAHVSISPASAIDASRSAADLIILGDHIDRVADTISTARVARARIRENLVLAFIYNVVTVPIAFAGLVTPLIAAISMSASSIVVALNATRLGRSS